MQTRGEIYINISINLTKLTLKTYVKKYNCKVLRKPLLPIGVKRTTSSTFY
ncbi:hypothetical protein PZA11_003131 [Diplocarpon coronariae]